MAINKTLNLTWEGVDYSVIMTMRMIDQIESQDINLIKMSDQLNRGDVRFSHIAKLIAILLQFAGAKVTQDDIWTGMFGDGDLSAADCVPLLREILAAVFPEVKKKPIAKPKKQRKTSKSTRGKISIK